MMRIDGKASLCAVCGHSEYVHRSMVADHAFVPAVSGFGSVAA